MAYSIDYTNRFKKDLKRCQKRHLDLSLIRTAIDLLAANGCLPQQYKPHKLSGNMNGIWECHITPDWLMTWEQNDNVFTLLFLQTGTHSDIF